MIVRLVVLIGVIAALALPDAALAQPALGGALDRALAASPTADATPLSLSLQILLLMGLLTLLPAIVLMMTSFTRILIVLSILRQALGLQQSPPNQVLIGLALFLSLFVMAPTLSQVNTLAIEPYAAGTLSGEQAIAAAAEPFHAF